MRKLEDLILGYEISDARAAFYYLSRYLKQADYFDEYEKDFFEDDYQSHPSAEAKKLTFLLIGFLEKSIGKKAAEFSENEYMECMDAIDLVENQLDPEPSGEIRRSAELVIDELTLPNVGKNK
jgi:hypothetical protein